MRDGGAWYQRPLLYAALNAEPLAEPFGPIVFNQDDCLLNMTKDDSYEVRLEALSSLAKLVQTEAKHRLVVR